MAGACESLQKISEYGRWGTKFRTCSALDVQVPATSSASPTIQPGAEVPTESALATRVWDAHGEKMREGTRLHTAGTQLAEFAQALPSSSASSASSPPAATATATSEVVSDGPATGKKDGGVAV